MVGLITPGLLSSSFQFMVVGVFGDKPEPAIAVDAISIAPCGGENRALGTPVELGVGVMGGAGHRLSVSNFLLGIC